ncbi:hypothetical protein CRG98_035986 [Punica granatum]|uniref:Uncharacterized protein n=1 Tax=Punica granatum TaxID=22663 RepID=A0A2I0IIR2_PUNGR|nr:hypothetical protein CRG98_035986 [Punica granatum]
MAVIDAPTPWNRENPQIGNSLDSGGWSHNPCHHPLIGVTGALHPTKIAGDVCGLNSVKINEKLDAVLELLSNRNFVSF